MTHVTHVSFIVNQRSGTHNTCETTSAKLQWFHLVPVPIYLSIYIDPLFICIFKIDLMLLWTIITSCGICKRGCPCHAANSPCLGFGWSLKLGPGCQRYQRYQQLPSLNPLRSSEILWSFWRVPEFSWKSRWLTFPVDITITQWKTPCFVQVRPVSGQLQAMTAPIHPSSPQRIYLHPFQR